MTLPTLLALAVASSALGTLAFRRFLRWRLATLADTLALHAEWPTSDVDERDVRDDAEGLKSRTARLSGIEHAPVEVTTVGDREPRYVCPLDVPSCSRCRDRLAEDLAFDRARYAVAGLTTAEADAVRRFARADAARMLA